MTKNEKETFIDKQTAVKTIERIKFSSEPFSKGTKIKITWAFNPDDPTHVDQFLEADPAKNNVLIALNGFKKIVRDNLGQKILTDSE